MTACQHCGHSHSDASPPRDGPRTDLARVGSVAEAGYLVSLLEEADLDATARPAESFNAVHGSWTNAYHISVPTDQVEIAAQILRAEADGSFAEVAQKLYQVDEERGIPTTVNPWQMLTVLALIAASGMLLVMNHLDDRPDRPAKAAPDDKLDQLPIESATALLATLQKRPVPLTTSPQEGGPRQRLRYSRSAEAFILSTDADRDGRYETHRRFLSEVGKE